MKMKAPPKRNPTISIENVSKPKKAAAALKPPKYPHPNKLAPKVVKHPSPTPVSHTDEYNIHGSIDKISCHSKKDYHLNENRRRKMKQKFVN